MIYAFRYINEQFSVGFGQANIYCMNVVCSSSAFRHV